MIIGSYIRLSKRSQATKQAIANHLFQLKKAAIEIEADVSESLIFADIASWVDRRWDVDKIPSTELNANLIFIDVASGRRNDRVEFLKVYSAIERNELDVLIVRQDRFSRDVEMTHKLSKLFERSRCKLFEILRWRFVNFADPEDWAEFQKRGVTAEAESRTTSRRIRYQKEFMKSQQKMLGRAPFGYKRAIDGKPEPNPEKWAIALQMVEIFFECKESCHLASRMIREKTGVDWTHAGLHLWLRNPILRGHIAYGAKGKHGFIEPSEIIYNTHQALLNEEQVKRIDRALIAGKKERRSVINRNLYPLARLLVCDRCGSDCRINTTTDSKYGYKYSNIYCTRHQSGKGCGGLIQQLGKQYGQKPNGRYNRLATPYRDAEKAVIEALRVRASELAVQGITPQDTEDLPEIARQKLLLTEQIKRYESLLTLDPDLLPVVNKKRNELKMLCATQAADSFSSSIVEAREKLVSLARDPVRWDLFWDEATPEERLVLFSDWVDSVGCDRDSISVLVKI